MLSFRSYLVEVRRMSRETQFRSSSVSYYAPGQPKAKKGEEPKSNLDRHIADHRVKQKQFEYSASKSEEEAKTRGSKFKGDGPNPVYDHLKSIADKKRHLAKRHRQAAEAGERVKSGTERKPGTKHYNPNETKSDGSKKKGLFSRLFGR